MIASEAPWWSWVIFAGGVSALVLAAVCLLVWLDARRRER